MLLFSCDYVLHYFALQKEDVTVLIYNYDETYVIVCICTCIQLI